MSIKFKVLPEGTFKQEWPLRRDIRIHELLMIDRLRGLSKEEQDELLVLCRPAILNEMKER